MASGACLISAGASTLIRTVTVGDTKPRYWSKSGMLYYEEKHNLFALDLKSGQTAQLTSFDSAQTTAYSLAISPDEKQIVYITAEGEQYGVWTMTARGGAARQIVNSAVGNPQHCLAFRQPKNFLQRAG